MNPRPSLREIHCPPGTSTGAPASDRLPQFMGCTVDISAMLSGLKVAVVGCGSVGGRIALALARLGVQWLVLIDPKAFKAQSHLTHESTPSDVGRAKAIVTAQRSKRIHPATRVFAFVGSIQQMSLTVLMGLDAIFLATDNLLAELATGEIATLLSKPLIHGSLHGASLTTQVRTHTNASADHPCPACGFGTEELEDLDRGTRFSCEGSGQAIAVPDNSGQATEAGSSQCSLSADLAVNQFLRLTLKLGRPVGDTLLTHNGFTHESVISPLRRNPACRCLHLPGKVISLPEPLDELSLRDILAKAGTAEDRDTALVELDGFRWIESGTCSCADSIPVRRFLSHTAVLRRKCASCGNAVKPVEFEAHRAVTTGTLANAVPLPVKRLGARGVRTAVIRTANEAVLLNYTEE